MRIAIVLFVVPLGLTACAATIMATAPSQSSFVRDGSQRQEIRKALGEPVLVKTFEKPTPIKTPEGADPYEPIFLKAGGGQSTDLTYSPETLAESVETYKFPGLVKGEHDIGELVAMAGYTFGLTEIIAVPKVAKARIMSESVINTVWVWYSDSGEALAYVWKPTRTGSD